MCANGFIFFIFFEMQTCCRASSVLSHVLKGNVQCKERVSNHISFSLLSSHAFSTSVINICILCILAMYVACITSFVFFVILLLNKRTKKNYHHTITIKQLVQNKIYLIFFIYQKNKIK